MRRRVVWMLGCAAAVIGAFIGAYSATHRLRHVDHEILKFPSEQPLIETFERAKAEAQRSELTLAHRSTPDPSLAADGARIRVITAPDSRPLPGALVTTSGSAEFTSTVIKLVTDDNGETRVNLLQHRMPWMLVASLGFAPRLIPPSSSLWKELADGDHAIDVTLGLPTQFRVTVVDLKNRPVPGAHLVAYGAFGPEAESAQGADPALSSVCFLESITDQSGGARFDVGDPPPRTVRVSAWGYNTTEVKLIPDDVTLIRLHEMLAFGVLIPPWGRGAPQYAISCGGSENQRVNSLPLPRSERERLNRELSVRTGALDVFWRYYEENENTGDSATVDAAVHLFDRALVEGTVLLKRVTELRDTDIIKAQNVGDYELVETRIDVFGIPPELLELSGRWYVRSSNRGFVVVPHPAECQRVDDILRWDTKLPAGPYILTSAPVHPIMLPEFDQVEFVVRPRSATSVQVKYDRAAGARVRLHVTDAFGREIRQFRFGCIMVEDGNAQEWGYRFSNLDRREGVVVAFRSGSLAYTVEAIGYVPTEYQRIELESGKVSDISVDVGVPQSTLDPSGSEMEDVR